MKRNELKKLLRSPETFERAMARVGSAGEQASLAWAALTWDAADAGCAQALGNLFGADKLALLLARSADLELLDALAHADCDAARGGLRRRLVERIRSIRCGDKTHRLRNVGAFIVAEVRKQADVNPTVLDERSMVSRSSRRWAK